MNVMRSSARSATPPRTPPTIAARFEWLALGGLLLFAGWLLGLRGVWALLLGADPTGITLIIVVVFAGATLWCGSRAR